MKRRTKKKYILFGNWSVLKTTARMDWGNKNLSRTFYLGPFLRDKTLLYYFQCKEWIDWNEFIPTLLCALDLKDKVLEIGARGYSYEHLYRSSRERVEDAPRTRPFGSWKVNSTGNILILNDSKRIRLTSFQEDPEILSRLMEDHDLNDLIPALFHALYLTKSTITIAPHDLILDYVSSKDRCLF